MFGISYFFHFFNCFFFFSFFFLFFFNLCFWVIKSIKAVFFLRIIGKEVSLNLFRELTGSLTMQRVHNNKMNQIITKAAAWYIHCSLNKIPPPGKKN